MQKTNADVCQSEHRNHLSIKARLSDRFACIIKRPALRAVGRSAEEFAGRPAAAAASCQRRLKHDDTDLPMPRPQAPNAATATLPTPGWLAYCRLPQPQQDSSQSESTDRYSEVTHHQHTVENKYPVGHGKSTVVSFTV